MNNYVYTEKSGLPCIEYTGNHHERLTRPLTTKEFDQFVDFKTMQHSQTQQFFRDMIGEL